MDTKAKVKGVIIKLLKVKPEELKAVIKDYDALIVRSSTKATAEIIEAATKLSAIGRAGAGGSRGGRGEGRYWSRLHLHHAHRGRCRCAADHGH